MTDLKRYLRKFTVFSAIIFLLSIFFAVIADTSLISKAYYYFVPYFYVFGILNRYLLHIAQKHNGLRFSLVYLGISMGRLLLSIVILVGYSMVFREDAYPFMIGFFIFYLLFTTYEIILLQRTINRKKANE
jgi:hypothetical protein